MAKLDEAEIARIVARAGGLGPRERFAYIKSACANDADAFDRVLLAHNITRENRLKADGQDDDRAVAHVLRLYRHRLDATDAAGGNGDAQALKDKERGYRLLALNAERDTVLRLARRMDISDETARRLLRRIDLLEARYQLD